MTVQGILRDIRKNRDNKLNDNTRLTDVEHRQILLIDPGFDVERELHRRRQKEAKR